MLNLRVRRPGYNKKRPGYKANEEVAQALICRNAPENDLITAGCWAPQNECIKQSVNQLEDWIQHLDRIYNSTVVVTDVLKFSSNITVNTSC